MARKFSPSRLYKLTKMVVIVVSVFLLFQTIKISINLERITDENWSQYLDCTKMVPVTKNPVTICGFYLDSTARTEKLMQNSFLIGIGLLILFFGGSALYRYLAPELEPDK